MFQPRLVAKRKLLPKRNWLQKLIYRWYMQLNYRLNVIPMRNSRFKYTLRLIIGISIWLIKLLWMLALKVVDFLNFGITIKKGKTRTSQTYLVTVKGYAITLAIKKMKSR
jgi:hypothetical protein